MTEEQITAGERVMTREGITTWERITIGGGISTPRLAFRPWQPGGQGKHAEVREAMPGGQEM